MRLLICVVVLMVLSACGETVSDHVATADAQSRGKQAGPIALSASVSHAENKQITVKVQLKSSRLLHNLHVQIVDADQLQLTTAAEHLFEVFNQGAVEDLEIVLKAIPAKTYILLRIDFELNGAKRQISKRISLAKQAPATAAAEKPAQRTLKLMPASQPKK